MAEVKIPPMLHKMSVSAQKAWYKKNKMEYPGPEKSAGKSAARVKLDVGAINLKKAKEKTALQKALETSPKQKEIKKSSERVRQMASNAMAFGGQRPGGDLTTARGIVSYVRSGGTLKAGRLGEAAKPDASMAMTDQLKKKMISDKDKQTLGKVAALMASAKNKDKKNEYVRQLGLKAMKKGEVDPARGHSPTRFGREVLRKEEIEQIDELKSSTLQSYLDKRPAPKFKDIARKETVGKPEERQKDIERANLTRIGRMRAKAKLLKRNPPPRTTPEYDPNDRGYGQGRYMGDDVNLEGQTMNEGMMKDIVTDREETARLKAQEILGGPVKEKPKMPPGKQPAGYRYVRGLARKAMKKGMKEEVEIKEEIKDAADVGEYDYEGDMAKSQLRSILVNAKRMHDMLEENTNLPEWVQSKITLAQDYIQTAASYMEAEMNEEVKQVEEGAKDWKKAFSNVAQKNLQKDVGKMRSKVSRLNYIGMKPKVDERPKVTAAVTKGGTYSEEVVTEAEGKVAMTPQEKTLAAHHGDKTKITYGDVIKARIKSAKEKALKGNK